VWSQIACARHLSYKLSRPRLSGLFVVAQTITCALHQRKKAPQGLCVLWSRVTKSTRHFLCLRGLSTREASRHDPLIARCGIAERYACGLHKSTKSRAGGIYIVVTNSFSPPLKAFATRLVVLRALKTSLRLAPTQKSAAGRFFLLWCTRQDSNPE
jgi:hypothetical protein